MRADGILLRHGHPDYEECAQKRRDLRQDAPTEAQPQPGRGTTQPQVHDRTWGGKRPAPFAPLRMSSERVERDRAQRARVAAQAAAWGGADDMGGTHASSEAVAPEDFYALPPEAAGRRPQAVAAVPPDHSVSYDHASSGTGPGSAGLEGAMLGLLREWLGTPRSLRTSHQSWHSLAPEDWNLRVQNPPSAPGADTTGAGSDGCTAGRDTRHARGGC